MSAGHDCSTPVSGSAVMEDAAATSASTASSTSAMSLQKKVNGGASSGLDGSVHRARCEPPFLVPNALEAMAAGMQGGARRWEGFGGVWVGARVHFRSVGFFFQVRGQRVLPRRPVARSAPCLYCSNCTCILCLYLYL